ncbi:MAG: phenylalanine--tRNA ligase subunit beta [Chloroflexi bacterium]|nr:phenylalanine--tRNA ligase subunit beta [Chloroflexota bacterium]
MKVSLKWLKDYVDLVAPAQEIARLLTSSGTEVGAIEYVGGRDWSDIYVGQITNLAPHPNADRLQLVTVDYGKKELTVVAGAFNIKVGDRVPLALPGARVIDTHGPEPREVVLKASKLRGVMSEGMLCSARELGISDDHGGILVLDPEARVGAGLGEVLGDIVFDLEVTPNRPDLLSMIGVAREIAALTGQELRVPVVTLEDGPTAVKDLIDIEIADPDLCHRYSATVIEGVRVGPSPGWMQERLIAAGMRPINNIVDVTNYVMLEWGQPLHGFDYDKIGGKKIVVRRAREGEEIETLDGVVRKLTSDMLVIADARHPVAIAGVMGGADSEVSDATTNVLLESANFDRVVNRRASRALRLPSEASRRFEKGLPEELTMPAALRATQLIHQLAGGAVARGVADAYPVKPPPVEIKLTTREVQRLLGVSYSVEEIERILKPLGFVTRAQGGDIDVVVPMHRGDVTLPADLVEEVARTVGYDAIPSTMLDGRLPVPSENLELRWQEVVRDVLVGCGFTEIIAYSLISRERMRKLVPSEEAGEKLLSLADPILTAINTRISVLGQQPLLVVNPLTSDMECLRTTTLVSMLETIGRNLRFMDKDVNLFEICRVYLPRGEDLPEERRIITAGMGQYRSGGEWGEKREVSFFDLKAAAEAILQRMGIATFSFVPVAHPTFHAGRTAAIVFGVDMPRLAREGVRAIAPDKVVGILGEINPDVRASFDLDERVYVLAMDFDSLMQAAVWTREYRPLPKFPPVEQDIAVVSSVDIPAELVKATISRAGGELVKSVDLFDVYQGPGIPEGKRSIAYHIVYQAPDRTLTDEEVSKVQKHIEDVLEKELRATLRR